MKGSGLTWDEATFKEFIKNPKAHSHRVARQLKARHRLSLTGTPLENHLGELWSVFEFLNPGILGRSLAFRRVTAPGQVDARTTSLVARGLKPAMFKSKYAADSLANATAEWKGVQGGTGARFSWKESSTYIQEPPFFKGFSMTPPPVLAPEAAMASSRAPATAWPPVASRLTAITKAMPTASQNTCAAVSRADRRRCSCGMRSASATYMKLLLATTKK